MGEDPENPGFDFAVVDQLAHSEGVLLTLLEAKYSGEEVKTRLSIAEIVKKFKLALQGRPAVQRAFVNCRLCYAIGGLRRLEDDVTASCLKDLVHTIADELPAFEGLPDEEADKRDLVACSLVVLNRPLVKVLLTPTLSSLPPFVRLAAGVNKKKML